MSQIREGSEESDEASKNEGDRDLEKKFELWWQTLLKGEAPYYSEYVKIKKMCRDAFLAGNEC